MALFGVVRAETLDTIGVEKRMEDLAGFNSDKFVETLVDGIYA